jgi:putative tryptophan/tyrosine transport system substrate-binding protein
MKRRNFITLIGAGAAMPLVARAQQRVQKFRIGVLGAGQAPAPNVPNWAAFRQGLLELGYIEGKNLVLEGRFAAGDLERLAPLARELAALKVNVIVVFGPAPMRATQAAAPDIPIVMVAGSSDPVGEGYIASFARPGGNITGLTYAVSAERFGKQLELLTEAVGVVSRVAVLWDADLELFHRSIAPALNEAARRFNVKILGPFLVQAPEQFDRAFDEMADKQAQAVIVTATSIVLQNQKKVSELALRHSMPTMAAFRELAVSGILMSYGPNFLSIYHRASAFMDKILKGTPPGEIPVAQPVKYDLVINLRTAKAIGVTIPPTLVARADEVIE